MESTNPLNPLPESLPQKTSSPPGRIRRGASAFTSFWRRLPQAARSGWRGFRFVSSWCRREAAYWLRLFLFTSRRFLRIEAYLALAGALVFFGWILDENLAANMRDLLHYGYLYFTAVMVMLCMNLLPRERDENTLEILWSQPMRRGAMVFFQLFTVSIWVLLLSLLVIFFFGYFGAYPGGEGTAILFLFTTSFTVGAITILISTFCRHGIATGLVALLILGVHFYWLRPLGPIELFYNPIPPPGAGGRGYSFWFFVFNRVITLVLAGFVLDYLFRRLRQTAKWFT